MSLYIYFEKVAINCKKVNWNPFYPVSLIYHIAFYYRRVRYCVYELVCLHSKCVFCVYNKYVSFKLNYNQIWDTLNFRNIQEWLLALY